jgi:hypothetical protein
VWLKNMSKARHFLSSDRGFLQILEGQQIHGVPEEPDEPSCLAEIEIAILGQGIEQLDERTGRIQDASGAYLRENNRSGWAHFKAVS